MALFGLACGGRAAESDNNAGTGGQPTAASGGDTGAVQGGRAQGGQAQGGQAQGGQAQGGITAGGGKPATGGVAAVGGSAQGGSYPGDCTYQGQRHKISETFTASDGCNTCRCSADGTVACTRRVCAVCPDFDREYAKLYQEAKRCDPTSSAPQCQQLIASGLPCGCNSFVNSTNSAAIERMNQIQEEYATNRCAEDPGCGTCGLEPAWAFCSGEGLCQDRGDKQRNCMVSGKVYPHGSTGIPDPGSCNTCECDDGNLSCTLNDCATRCQTGTAAGTQCAECTPLGVCLMPDYECLPTCTDTCPKANEVCIGGLCKSGLCD